MIAVLMLARMHLRTRLVPPRPVDLALAGGLLIASLMEAIGLHSTNGPTGLVVTVSVVTVVPLVWRRSLPVVAVAGTLVGLVIPLVVGSPADGLTLLVANLVAVHAVNAYGTRSAAAVGTSLVVVAYTALIETSPSREAGAVIWASVLILLAAASGQLMSTQARSAQSALETAEREAIAAERRAVAADLHDVIAHGIALMVVQSGAAAAIMDADPDRARLLLDGVQTTGARSAAELHQLIGVLAPGTSNAIPTPGIDGLAALFDEARASGASARLIVDLDVATVPEGVSHAVYRVVREALTNALKHSPGAPVVAEVCVHGTDLRVDVGNGRPIEPLSPAAVGGFGLIAMRERVHMFGGDLQSGPTSEGWQTVATFPLATPLDISP